MPLVEDTALAFMPYPDAPVAHAATGPLSGLTLAVKDLYDVAGYPTGGGQPFVLAMSGIKTGTAPAVQMLLDAGARFVGKTMTDELAFSMFGDNAHYGAPVNGAAPDRIVGGSSSGSAAAVSNSLCDFALGSDTGGSVRAPANHCGLYGIRPTQDRISMAGVLALAPSLDTCGYFARDVQTFARVSEVLLGADAAPLPQAVRLLKPTDLWALLDPEVTAAQAEPLARVEATLGAARPVAVVTGSLDEMYWAFRFILGREAWLVDGPLIERFKLPLGPGVAERFESAKGVTDEQFNAAVAYRTRCRDQLAQLLGSDGVLVLPTMPDIAPLRHGESKAMERYRQRSIELLCLAGLTGFAQITLPLGQRLLAPLGLSLLGPAGSDRSLVRLAERIGAPGR